MKIPIKYSKMSGFWTACASVIAALLLLGCEEFVTVDVPDSQLAGAAVFEDAATADAAMVSIYSTLQSRALVTGETGGISILMGCYADELVSYSNWGLAEEAFYQNSLQASDAGVATLWNEGYSVIYSANAIIEGLAGSSAVPQADKDRITGEALLVRTYVHNYLTSLFGAVPYVTSTDYRVNTAIARSAQNEVYGLLLTDLQRAHDLLPEAYYTADRSRPNKAVAAALLARIYLYSGQWQAASDAASEVLNATAMYNIESNPEDVFDKESASTLWQLLPRSEGMPTFEALNFFFEAGPPPSRALSPLLVAAFEPGDLRRDHWVGEVTDGTSTWYYANKYRQHDFGSVSTEYSIQLRLEEQLLIRAEARARAGDLIGAKEDLDILRLRAGLSPTTAATADELVAAVLQERRVELFTEMGHRIFDLVRTGQAGTVLNNKPGWDANDILLPLPERELTLNPNLLPQNPGY